MNCLLNRFWNGIRRRHVRYPELLKNKVGTFFHLKRGNGLKRFESAEFVQERRTRERQEN